MVRHDSTAPLMCVMVGVGVVALALSSGEGPERRTTPVSAPGLGVPDGPDTATGGGSLDFPLTEQSHGHE